MEPARFLDDLRLIPERLGMLADVLEGGLPGLDQLSTASTGRTLILGMGSSAYAADIVAREARAAGANVQVELASSRVLPPPAPDLTVVAVSATGGSVEVLSAIKPYIGHGRLIAVTNRRDSKLAASADAIVELAAGPEESGIACRTFRHTMLVLAALLNTRDRGADEDRRPAAIARRAAEASQFLLDTRREWLIPVAQRLDGPDGCWTLAPVERLSSARQSALMMREVPRRAAYASETGDWSHVDVYLTKTLDYRALLFAGSEWDDQALEWMRERDSTLVSVGRDIDFASQVVRFPYYTEDDVARLTEVLVAELVAEHWWRETA